MRAGLPRRIWLEASVLAVRAGQHGHTIELADASAGKSAALLAFLPAAVLRAICGRFGLTLDPTLLAGMTIVVLLEPSFDSRWHLGARVVDLARTATASLRRPLIEQSMDTLRREGLWDRQRGLPAPGDVTRLTIVHPAGAG